MVLFAYASNMNVDEFAKTVPSAKKICNAKLPGYRFSFNLTADDGSSKASLVPSTEMEAAAWGVLIEFNDDELDTFFFQDDWFDWTAVHCLCQDGKVCKAHAFVTKPHAINDFTLPYDWYQAKIIRFAKEQGLPDEYITALSLMPHKVDPDEKRRARRMRP